MSLLGAVVGKLLGQIMEAITAGICCLDVLNYVFSGRRICVASGGIGVNLFSEVGQICVVNYSVFNG